VEQLLSFFRSGPDNPLPCARTCTGVSTSLPISHAHLAHWNPFIQFCGLFNEAQLGLR
jgi:hypothetical protein